MEKKVEIKRFSIAEYEKEEKYLCDMRANGWKLVNVTMSFPGAKYEFVKCDPENCSYQLDFIKDKENDDSYNQLFIDAGWEKVSSLQFFNGTWNYFCKKNSNGQEKIFTDGESRIGLIDRIIACYFMFFIIMGCTQINGIILSFDKLFGSKSLDGFDISVIIVTLAMASLLIILFIYLMFIRMKLKSKIRKRL